jgi:hypothetical protein
MHNALGLTKPVEEKIVQFFGRPFRVIFAERFTEAIREKIENEAGKLGVS